MVELSQQAKDIFTLLVVHDSFAETFHFLITAGIVILV